MVHPRTRPAGDSRTAAMKQPIGSARRVAVARGVVVLLSVVLGQLVAANILAGVLPLMRIRVSPAAAWAMAAACALAAVIAGVRITRSAAP